MEKVQLSFAADWSNKEVSRTLFFIKNQGLFYLEGVDCRFRPLIVIRCDQVIASQVSAEDMKATAAYFLDHIARNLFLPGQVENWVVLVDLKDISIMNVPYSVAFFHQDS